MYIKHSCVFYYWCTNKPCICTLVALITITSYLGLNTVQYIPIIFKIIYNKWIITDAHRRWVFFLEDCEDQWRLCTYGHQRLLPQTWSLVLTELVHWCHLQIAEFLNIQNVLIFNFGLFSNSEWIRVVVYMQSFDISLWLCLVWQGDLYLFVKVWALHTFKL